MNGGPGSHPRAGAACFNVPHQPLLDSPRRVVGRYFVDVAALRAFEDAQTGPVATRRDVDQHHAILAGRAEWPGYGDQRRFRTSVDLGHMKLLPIWRGMLYPKPPPLAADSPAATWRACRALMPATVQYCSYQENCLLHEANDGQSPITACRADRDVRRDRWSLDCAILLSKPSAHGSIWGVRGRDPGASCEGVRAREPHLLVRTCSEANQI